MVPNWFWHHLSRSRTLTAWQTLNNLTIALQRLSLSCKSKCSHLDLKVKCDGHGQLAPFDGGTGKSTFFSSVVISAWCIMFPTWRALLPAKDRRDGWTGGVNRTVLGKASPDLSLCLGICPHSSPWWNFMGSLCHWLVKRGAPLTQQI